MTEIEKFDELLVKGHELSGKLIELAELTKKYYEETENEYFRDLFLILNQAYCHAGREMSKAHVDVTSKHIDLLLDILAEMN